MGGLKEADSRNEQLKVEVSLDIRPEDIRECDWWGPINFALVNTPKDGAQGRLATALIETFAHQYHNFIEDPQRFTVDPQAYAEEKLLTSKSGRLELIFAFEDIPEGPEPLVQRVREREWPLGLALKQEFGLIKRPDNLVTLVTIPEPLGDKSHSEVVDLAHIVMARIGTPRVLFITGDKKTGDIDEVTLCTLEGGHPTISSEDFDFLAQSLRNRLVALARTEQVGDKYIVKEGAISRETFQALLTPDALITAGARMDQLGLLPEPLAIADFVSPKLAKIYERFLNMKRFSEGMLCVWDPEINCMVVTGSGSWGVDKRHLQREQALVVSGVDDEDNLIIEGVEGIKQTGPSVEGFELFACFDRAPKIRLGDREVPIIRSMFHAHVGIEKVDESLVEVVPTNWCDFPYPFCCGSDLNLLVSTDAVERSQAINNPYDPRSVVVWKLENHGIVVAELWKGEVLEKRALQHALDMFDHQAIGAVNYTPDHIAQN